MFGQFIKRERKLVGLVLVVYFLFMRLLPVCAEIRRIEPVDPKNGPTAFELPNTTVKTTASLYPQIQITAQPVNLKGSLKGKYKAFYYTLQNQSADTIHIQIIHYEKALDSLEKVQFDRKSHYMDRLIIIPTYILYAGGFVACVPLMLVFAEYPTMPVVHSPLFALAITPITTSIGVIGAGASVAATVGVITYNAISLPFVTAVNHHNDKISLRQIRDESFKEILRPIALKTGEASRFIIITPVARQSGEQPQIQIDQ